MRLQQTIHEQNLSKPEGLGNSAPLRSGQRICYGEEYELMSNASVEYWNQPIRNWVGRACLLGMSGEELVLANDPETGVACWVTVLGIVLRAPRVRVHTGYSRLLSQMMECAWNLGTFVRFPLRGMIKTADDRRIKGRSLRSSLRTGKPSTWRREAVDRVLQQEVGSNPAW